MRYEGRPGISPALSLLIAEGRIRKEHHILDVGCGKGTDALLLGRWGFRRVVGIDSDKHSVAIARRRAARLGLQRRVVFLHLAAEDLPTRFEPRSVDVALHTLVGNNLAKHFHRHFRAVHAVMKPNGLLVACIRTQAASENAGPGRIAPLPGMRRYFDLTPSVSSQLAEEGRFHPPYARVALWVGRRLARPRY